jgi:hypothetical protein
MRRVQGSVDHNTGRSTEDSAMEGPVCSPELGLTAGSGHESSSRWDLDEEGGARNLMASSPWVERWREGLAVVRGHDGEASLGTDGAV